MLGLFLLQLVPESVNPHLVLVDSIIIVCLQSLNIADDLEFDIFLLHLRIEDEVDELLELQVLRRDILVSAGASDTL